jgi:uncharacterized protein (DUF934 family)
MSKLIRGSIRQGGAVAENIWHTIVDFEQLDDLPAGTALLVPLAMWDEYRQTFIADAKLTGASLGVLLAPQDDPAAIAPDLAHFKLIAIDFPQFADGRGYSIARLLRERYGYTGELRAVGDVLRDQIYYLLRVGFDSFLLAERKSDEQSVAAVLTAYQDFSENYQTSVEQKQPLFRRRLVSGAAV